MPVALALSPHLDDAVFSCGGLLGRLAEAGWRVEICTVFTASVARPQGFALACQLDKGIGPEIDYMALRREEDRAAGDLLGLSAPACLPFPEAPHRGYGSPAALFGAVLADDDIVERIVPVLRDRVAAEDPDLLLAPQAVGGHVDHVQLVRAVQAMAPGRPVAWWRDFPYAVREAAPEPFGAGFGGLREAAIALSATERARKRHACLAYASQIGFQFGGADGVDRFLDAGGALESLRIAGTGAVLDAFADPPTVTTP